MSDERYRNAETTKGIDYKGVRQLYQDGLPEAGVREAMVPAIRLIELPGIFIDNQRKAVTYHHLVFDQHEVIFAEGAPTESFYPGPIGLAAISPEAKQRSRRFVHCSQNCLAKKLN